MTFKDYYETVKTMAVKYGYTEKQVNVFISDIQEAYLDGKTVEECIDTVF